MDVRCDKCGTEYEFDENRIGANGVTVKCTACGFVFKVRRPGRRPPPRASTTIGSGPQGREWLVRRPDGQMIAFRELTTLQKWIVEGRINRNDEISKNGETWKRLGNIMELEPFFSVYEKAQTLNSMIEQGAPGQRLELRGSELLSAMNPVDPSALAPGAMYTIPPRAAIVQADDHPSAAIARQTIPPPSSSLPEQFTPIPDPPARPPLQDTVNARPASSNGAPPTDDVEPSPMLPPPPLVSARAPSNVASPPRVVEERTRSAATGAAIDRTAPIGSTGFAGPGALDNAQRAPASFGSATLDFDMVESGITEDPVRAFERGQKRKRLFWTLLLVAFAGVGAGLAYALYGPPDNPARVLAEQYGVLELIGGDDGVAKLVEAAELEADRDTSEAQQKRLALLDEANRIRPSDPILVAERALAASMIARGHAMRAIDLETAASMAEESIAKWQRELDAINAMPKNVRPSLPAKPSAPDPAALRTDAKHEVELAEQVAAGASKLAETAAKADPEAFEVSRALAARHLATGASGLAQGPLDQAKRSATKSGQMDPQTLYLESVLVAGDLSNAEQIKNAATLADQALTIRPTMNRARVWLARLYLAADKPVEAKKELDRILASTANHQEAKNLLARVVRPAPAVAPPAAPPPEVAAPTEPAKAPPEPTKAPEPEKDFDYWMARADRLRERDKTKSALNAYGRAAELRPNSAETHTGKGWCFLDMERPRLALTSFDRALKVNERYVEAYYGRAESYRALGNTSASIAAYKAYLNRAPNGAERRAAELALKRLETPDK